MMFKHPFNWFNKFGTIPESYTEAMSYEEQIMWLCKEIKENEDFIDEFREEFETLDGVIEHLEEEINGNHRDILNLQTNKQNKLTAGNGILIQNDTISTAPTYLNFLLQNGALNFNNVNIGDVFDLEPLPTANCNYLILDVNQGEKIEIIGKFDTALLNNNYQITDLEKDVEASSFNNPLRWEILSKCKMVVTWYDVNTNVPDIRLFMSSDFIYDEFQRKQNKLTAGSGITIQNNVISADASSSKVDISSLIKSGAYIDLSGSINDTVDLTPITASNTAYFIDEVITNDEYFIEGNVTLVEIDAENKIVNKTSGIGTSENPLIYDCIALLPSNARMILSFTNTDTITPKVIQNVDSITLFNYIAHNAEIQNFEQDLYLDDSSPATGLINGLYYTDKYHVYINNNISYQFDNALILANGSRLCVIASPSNNTNHLMYYQVYYNNNQWNYGFMHPSTTWSQVSDKPSINNLSENLYLVDGTATTGLDDGLYYTSSYHVYVNNNLYSQFDEALILIDGSSVYVVASPNIAHSHNMYYQINYTNGEWIFGIMHPYTDWSLINNKPTKTSDFTNDGAGNDVNMPFYATTNTDKSGLFYDALNYDTDTPLPYYNGTASSYPLESTKYKTQSISASSSHYQYPTAKAVYNNSLDVYSTTEKRVGTWTDNKPIYRKVFTGTKVSGTDSICSISDCDTIINTYGYIKVTVSASERYTYTLPYYESNSVFIRVQYGTGGVILHSSNGTYINGNYVLVAEYTKTTD